MGIEGKIVVVGSLNIDFIAAVDHMPKVGETILGKSLDLVCGGKGANQAYTAGKMGAHTTMLGMVGSDAQGEKLIDNLASVGVHTEHIKKLPGINTGVALISVNKEGDNNIIVIQGANEEVSREYIDENSKVIEASDIIIMQLEIPMETVVYAARKAKKSGKTVILDPAPASAEISDELLRLADIIKPNETELEILTGITVETIEDARRATAELVAKGAKIVIVTLGENGALLNDNGIVTHFPGRKVEVVDTTCAGDSFTAVMAYMLSQNRTLGEAIEFAIDVSAIVVTRKGAQSSIPDKEEIISLLSARDLQQD